ncbi:MAG: hypothetical protein IPN69_03345 [Acidobacteria bacterium]|nr:hypothetical protein [Acidobacteriota bacterium]MBK8809750.1 hypothetical protein [Acidobacteriota bacterium]
MNKSQVIWLIIRLFGVYLAYLALVSFFGLVGSIPALFTLPKLDAPNKNANVSSPTPIRSAQINPTGGFETYEDPTQPKTDKKDDDSITAKFKGENVTNFLWFLIVTAIYVVAAWYLLRDGRILFSVLNRERPDGPEKEREPEVTTLNL